MILLKCSHKDSKKMPQSFLISFVGISQILGELLSCLSGDGFMYGWMKCTKLVIQKIGRHAKYRLLGCTVVCLYRNEWNVRNCICCLCGINENILNFTLSPLNLLLTFIKLGCMRCVCWKWKVKMFLLSIKINCLRCLCGAQSVSDFFYLVDYEILLVLVVLSKSTQRNTCFMCLKKFTMDEESQNTTDSREGDF